jgi:hypothetical protein
MALAAILPRNPLNMLAQMIKIPSALSLLTEASEL